MRRIWVKAVCEARMNIRGNACACRRQGHKVEGRELTSRPLAKVGYFAAEATGFSIAEEPRSTQA